MRIIDFHVHAFPDTVAQRAIPKLVASSGYPAYTDGTFADTIVKMEQSGVSSFVLLNIASTPKQQRSVNDFLIDHNGGPVFSFGSLHPDAPDAMEELKRLADAGIKGVKFHPEYQEFDMDDPKAYPLYEAIAKKGMILLFHGGFDPAYPNSRRSYPENAAKVVRDFVGAKIIVAHLGNAVDPEETLTKLAGLDVYLDLAMTGKLMGKTGVERIIAAHGADKILYGSDSPWSGRDSIDFVYELDLSEQERAAIFYKNAEILLEIS